MEKRLKNVFCILAILLLLSGSAGLGSADGDNDREYLFYIEHLLVESAKSMKPTVMVASYVLTPETLMPGDVGLLTITLENVYSSPMDVEVKDIQGAVIDSCFVMSAYIEEASLSGSNFKVYNIYKSSGVIGPGKQVEFPFKIKAPYEDDIYMLKLYVRTENMLGKSSKSVRHYIPVIVSSNGLKMSPRAVSEESIKLEVTNEGFSKVDGVAVVASDIKGMELQKESVYIGEMSPWESALVVFNISSVAAEEQDNSADFRVVFNNWINEHESESICVKIPYHITKSEDKKEVQPATTTQNYMTTPEQKDVAEAKISGFGLVTAMFLLVVVAYLKGKRAKK